MVLGETTFRADSPESALDVALATHRAGEDHVGLAWLPYTSRCAFVAVTA